MHHVLLSLKRPLLVEDLHGHAERHLSEPLERFLPIIIPYDDLLAASAEGVTGLARARTERLLVGERHVQVTRVRITEIGQAVLERRGV